ncbi:hypothetical protein OG851_43350 (plasmid) [Streptomyces sp. NBC_00161]
MTSDNGTTPDRLTWAIIRAAVSGAVRATVAWLLEVFIDSP